MKAVTGQWTLALAALAALAGGCQAPSYVEGGRMEKGLVVVLPGIEGTSAFNAGVCEGLAAGYIEYGIEIYDWTRYWNPVLNLQDEAVNRRQAQILAERIVEYQNSYPGRPVFLVGQSGGGAMAVWTAEAMPEGRSIEGIVLLAVSLSPGYRLEKAMGHSRRGIVSFYSARDWVLLSVGTKVFTTMDGQHSESAGREGFDSPRTQAYGRLYQIAWDPSMTTAGNIGLHVTSGAGEFVRFFVAPLILCGRWDSELTTRVARGEWIDPREYPALTARAGANPPVVLPPPVPSPAAKPKLPVASPVRVAPPKPPAAKPPAARPPARPGEIPVEDG